MYYRPTAKYVIGLDIDSNVLTGALLTLRQGRPWIVQTVSEDLSQPHEISSAHHNVLHRSQPGLPSEALRNGLYVTGMSSQETLMRQLDIKLTKESDITSVLKFQAEPYVPYPIDQAVLDRIVVASDEEGSQLTLFAVRKDHLQQHLDLFGDLNIEPEVVGCVPQALARFSKEYSSEERPFFVVYMGSSNSTVLLVHQGVVLAGHAVPHSYLALVKACDEAGQAVGRVDFNWVTAETAPTVFQALEPLRQELVRSILALTKQVYGEQITQVLITGEGANLANLADYLASALQKDRLVPFTAHQPDIPLGTLNHYAVSIGLALGCLVATESLLNFRQEEFSYPHPWRRFQRPLAVYALLCLVIASLIFLLDRQGYQRDLTEARALYENVLEISGYTAVSLEHEAFGTPASQVVPTQKLTLEQINKRLDWIEQEIKGTAHVFPLKPNIPRVADVLAWICNSPQVVTEDPETGQRQAILRIENFSYVMVKRPDKNKPFEHYQVKIDLELSSKDPTLARDLHDKLTEPNEFIDPRSEVKWSASQGRYRVSFFLKDKTYYP